MAAAATVGTDGGSKSKVKEQLEQLLADWETHAATCSACCLFDELGGDAGPITIHPCQKGKVILLNAALFFKRCLG